MLRTLMSMPKNFRRCSSALPPGTAGRCRSVFSPRAFSHVIGTRSHPPAPAGMAGRHRASRGSAQ
ncbi:hypothetical protein C1S70_32450 [Azospirillum argentinense]|uniref:Uncharacterized protein n=1 Tax=Azospirillum argentinense TaxID=2970906 RepID=A0A2K1FQH4_9PROT|nr:hypothetical protein C1S70_32450 [Azospirillum argentinense]